MRRSKKRNLAGIPIKHLNVAVPLRSYEKLGKIAGPISLAETVEILIEREYRRRERKMESLPVANSSS